MVYHHDGWFINFLNAVPLVLVIVFLVLNARFTCDADLFLSTWKYQMPRDWHEFHGSLLGPVLPYYFTHVLFKHNLVAGAHFSPHFLRHFSKQGFGRFRWSQNNCHYRLGRSEEDETPDLQGTIIIVANKLVITRKSRELFPFIPLTLSKYWMVCSCRSGNSHDWRFSPGKVRCRLYTMGEISDLVR